MKNLFLTIVLLFGTVTVNIETAYGQCDSLIIYSDEMDKACIECWTNSPRKDSIIVLLNEFKDYSTSEINILTTDNTKLQKKVRRNRRMAIGGFSGLALLILLFGIK